jgi:hypothetical protein
MDSSEALAPGTGMRGLWRRLAVFVLLLAVGWIGLEWVMLRSPNSMSIKRDRLEALAGDVDTLILGSSETYYGLKPEALSGVAYNLANNAQTLYYDYELIKSILPKLPRLRRVYVLANYTSLYAELYDHPESYRLYGYLQEFSIPLQRKVDYFDLRIFSRVLLHSPHAALERLMTGFVSSRDKRIDDHGWYRVPDEDRWGLGLEDAAGRIAVHHSFMRKNYLPDNQAVLERLIQLLQERHVEVVLITTPVYPTYQAQMRPEMWEPEKATYEKIAARYGVRYLNFLNEAHLQAVDFEDASHLNAEGAEHFAHILEMRVGPITAGSPEISMAIASANLNQRRNLPAVR